MIHVPVGDPDCVEPCPGPIYRIDEPLAFAARIDYHSPLRAIIDYQVAVLLECADGECLDLHRGRGIMCNHLH